MRRFVQGTAPQALLAATVPNSHGGRSILSTLPMEQAIVLVGKDDRLDKSSNLLTRNDGFGTSIFEEKLQPRHNEAYTSLSSAPSSSCFVAFHFLAIVVGRVWSVEQLHVVETILQEGIRVLGINFRCSRKIVQRVTPSTRFSEIGFGSNLSTSKAH